MKLLSALLLSTVAISSSAFGKCVSLSYEVSGKITSSSGAGLSGAIVELSWRELGDQALRNASALTDASGDYLVHIDYNPLSGMSSDGDLCNGALSFATLRVLATGFVAYEGELKISARRLTANKSLQPIAPKRRSG